MIGRRPTQCDRMLGLLGDCGWHSTLEFIDPPLRILKPASRAHDLREQGFAIETRRITRPGRSDVYEYRLASAPVSVATLGTGGHPELRQRAGVELKREHAPRPIDDCMSCGKRAALVETADGVLICDECAAPRATGETVPHELDLERRSWLVTCPTCLAPKRATAKAGLIYLACGHFTRCAS